MKFNKTYNLFKWKYLNGIHLFFNNNIAYNKKKNITWKNYINTRKFIQINLKAIIELSCENIIWKIY